MYDKISEYNNNIMKNNVSNNRDNNNLRRCQQQRQNENEIDKSKISQQMLNNQKMDQYMQNKLMDHQIQKMRDQEKQMRLVRASNDRENKMQQIEQIEQMDQMDQTEQMRQMRQMQQMEQMRQMQQIKKIQQMEQMKKIQQMQQMQQMKQEQLSTNGDLKNDNINKKNKLIENELRNANDMKKFEKIKNNMTKDENEKLRNHFVKQLSVKKDNNVNSDVKEKYCDIINEYWIGKDKNNKEKEDKSIQYLKKKYWNQRNNKPYKVILKNENKEGQNFKKKEELIVYRVTNKDKDEKIIKNKYNELKKIIDEHDDELKDTYHLNKKTNYEKEFIQNNIIKYSNNLDEGEKIDDKLKKSSISYYKKQQEKMNIEKKRKDDLVESLISKGIFSKKELEEF